MAVLKRFYGVTVTTGVKVRRGSGDGLTVLAGVGVAAGVGMAVGVGEGVIVGVRVGVAVVVGRMTSGSANSLSG